MHHTIFVDELLKTQYRFLHYPQTLSNWYKYFILLSQFLFVVLYHWRYGEERFFQMRSEDTGFRLALVQTFRIICPLTHSSILYEHLVTLTCLTLIVRLLFVLWQALWFYAQAIETLVSLSSLNKVYPYPRVSAAPGGVLIRPALSSKK